MAEPTLTYATESESWATVESYDAAKVTLTFTENKSLYSRYVLIKVYDTSSNYLGNVTLVQKASDAFITINVGQITSDAQNKVVSIETNLPSITVSKGVSDSTTSWLTVVSCVESEKEFIWTLTLSLTKNETSSLRQQNITVLGNNPVTTVDFSQIAVVEQDAPSTYLIFTPPSINAGIEGGTFSVLVESTSKSLVLSLPSDVVS